MGQFDKAKKFNAEAIKIFEEFELIPEDYLKSLLRKGILAAEQGNFDSAKLVIIKAIDLAKKSEQFQLLGQAFFNLGYLNFSSQSYSDALSAFDEAKQHLSKFPNHLKLIRVLLAESVVHLNLKKPKQALDTLQLIDQEYLRITQNNHLLNVVRNNLATSLVELGRLKKAEDLINQALIYRKENRQIYEMLLLWELQADIALKRGEPSHGRDTYNKILDLAKGLPSEKKVDKLIHDIRKKVSKIEKK